MKSSNLIYIYKVYRAALMLLCVMSLFSCVKVDLCTESSHTHTGNIKIIYHWPEDISDEQRPDSMLALVNRIINTRRIGYVTDSEDSEGGRYRFGKVYDEVEDASSPTAGQPLIVGAGDYQIFAFNNDVADIDKGGTGMSDVVDYYFDNLIEYGDGEHLSTVGVRDLGISYVGRSVDDPRLYLYGKDWVDLNNYSKYIATDIKPIYRAANEHNEATQEYTFSVEDKGEVEVHLYPQKITQDITFSFPIYAGEGVEVDSILAEISGIPHKMMVYTGTLVVDTTYKMLFKMELDAEDPEEVTLKMVEGGDSVDYTFTKYECLHTISVMGLIANSSPENKTGPGILQICIYSHTLGDDGEVLSKTQYAKINLCNTINKANLVVTDDLGNIIQNPGTYEELPRTDTLRVDDDKSRLMVTRKGILSSSDDNNSVDSWLPCGDLDGDGDIDEDDRLEIEI